MKFWVACVAVFMAGTAFAQANKIQCWTDKNGQRMCGDNVPPEYAAQKREVIKNGRVVDTVKAAKTPEEIAEEKRKQQEADEASRRADYDRALMETYRNGKDIESMRDERLALIDTRIAAAEKNSSDTNHSLDGLRARVDALQKDNKPVDEHLAKQVKQYETAQQQNAAALTRYKAERNDVETKFNADLKRFNELKAASAAAKAAKPTAVTPAPAAGKKPGA